jgi:STE24 endopeptidase
VIKGIVGVEWIDVTSWKVIYFSLLGLYVCCTLGLELLNQRYSRRITDVPDFLSSQVDQSTFLKSREYTAAQSKLRCSRTVFSAALVAAFVGFAGTGMLDALVGRAVSEGYLQSVLYLLIVMMVSSVLTIPFSLYKTFRLEERFGFNRTTPTMWVQDWCKETIVSLIIMIPMLFALLYVMDQMGTYWWFYAFILIAGFQIALLVVYPLWIAPLFNKFSPLEPGELKSSLEQLASKTGFKTSGIYVMDGGRRSTHANAYFTGLRGSKRIVLFDTLVEQLRIPQLSAVLAHEIGHEKRFHVLKGMLWSLLLLLASLFVLSLVLFYEPIHRAFGFQEVSLHSALLVFTLASEPIAFFVSPLFAVFSRKHEYEADKFAVQSVGGCESLVSALVVLAKSNLSNLVPHTLYSWFYYSHPTLSDRVEALRHCEPEMS